MSNLPGPYEISLIDNEEFSLLRKLLIEDGESTPEYLHHLVGILENVKFRDTSAKGPWMYHGLRSRTRTRRAAFLIREFARFHPSGSSHSTDPRGQMVKLINAFGVAATSVDDLFTQVYCIEGLSNLAWSQPDEVGSNIDVSSVVLEGINLVDKKTPKISEKIVLHLLVVLSKVAPDQFPSSIQLFRVLNRFIQTSGYVNQVLAQYVVSQIETTIPDSVQTLDRIDKKSVFEELKKKIREEPAADAIKTAQALGLLASVDEAIGPLDGEGSTQLEQASILSDPSREAVSARIGLNLAGRSTFGTIVTGDDPRSGNPLTLPSMTPLQCSELPVETNEVETEPIADEVRAMSSPGASLIADLIELSPSDLHVLDHDEVRQTQLDNTIYFKSNYFLSIKGDVRLPKQHNKLSEGIIITRESSSEHSNIEHVTMGFSPDCIGINGIFEFFYKASDDDLNTISKALGELSVLLANHVDLEYNKLVDEVRTTQGKARKELTEKLGIVAATGDVETFEAAELGRLIGCGAPKERLLAAKALNKSARLGITNSSDIESAFSAGGSSEFNPSIFLSINESIAKEVLDTLSTISSTTVQKQQQVRHDVCRFLQEAGWDTETRYTAVNYLTNSTTNASKFQY